jgi:hypothetical protein
MVTQPPEDNIQLFRTLAQEMRETAARRAYGQLGLLISSYLNPDMVDLMVYVRTPLGHLTIVGAYAQLWSPSAPEVLAREPTLEEMAVVLQAAARGG